MIQSTNKKTIMENINHPAHYGGAENIYEAIKVIEAWELNFHLGNAVKYISRCGKKGKAKEDLKKALWYIQREIDNIEIAEQATIKEKLAARDFDNRTHF